jgi:hypothetical protein
MRIVQDVCNQIHGLFEGPHVAHNPRDELVSVCVLCPQRAGFAHRAGTALAFDELFGSARQLEHEYRALNEETRAWNITYRYISYALTPGSPYARAAVQVVSHGHGAHCATPARARTWT